MKTKDLVDHLNTIAKLKALAKDNQFSIRSFEFAARQIYMFFPEDISQNDSFMNITGLGPTTLKVIQEFVTTGTSSYYKELARLYPPACLNLTVLPSIGPKTALKLYKSGIRTIDQLKRLAQSNKLLGLVSEKIRQNIIKEPMEGSNENTNTE